MPLPLVDLALQHDDVASLHILRGILILVSDTSNLELDDARRAFERAIQLRPEHPEAYEELGHFFDAVLPDRERAEQYYRQALEKGAGQSCKDALQELLDEDP